jgi:pantetheine-phosphate adenylyltransferase
MESKLIKIGVYAGSFDPVTLGHMHVIEKAITMVDKLIILIADNPEKKYMNTIWSRHGMLIESIIEKFGMQVFEGSIEVDFLDHAEFTASKAIDFNATLLFRGLRNVIDFEYEHGIQDINKLIAPELTTVFIMPPPELVAVSSSVIRGMVGINGWEKVAEKYVTKAVIDTLNKNRLSDEL